MRRLAKLLAVALALGLALPESIDAKSSGGRSGGRSAGQSAGRSHTMTGTPATGTSAALSRSFMGSGRGAYTAAGSTRQVSTARLFSSAPGYAFRYAGYPGELMLPGDAIALDGESFLAGGVRYRVLGLDGLDPGDPAARERLQQLLASGRVGVRARGVDRFGRTTALVRVNGQDLAPMLRVPSLTRPR